MRITIVNGFFLPVPPLGGGSTEKSWFNLGREFAALGHEVVSFSRMWRGLPEKEVVDGVTHHRLPGHDHTRSLWRNLWCDFWWSWRVFRNLPEADIIICNAVTLPMWLGWLRPKAGKVVVMTGRMPKGQYKRYSHLARIFAPSSLVEKRLHDENPAFASIIRVTGYPIAWSMLSQPQPVPLFLPPRDDPNEVTLGFAGRIHKEKGLILLADALSIVSQKTDLPPMRLILCGPSDVQRGGSGPAFRGRLMNHFSLAVANTRFHLLDPEFNERSLAAIFQRLDVFCYPSLAEEGETFGVAVAEAMAAGAVPIVSNLACFRDFVRDGENGYVFDHQAEDAAAQLASVIERVLRNREERRLIAATARASVQCFDYPIYAKMLLDDFTKLLAPSSPPENSFPANS